MNRRVGIVMFMKGCGGEMSFYVVGEIVDVWLVMTIGNWDGSDRVGQMNCYRVCDTRRAAVEATLELPTTFVIQSKQYRRTQMQPSHNLGMSVDDLL